MQDTILYLVIPCYNEQQALGETMERLQEKMRAMIGEGLINRKSRVLFVDDGSKDDTWKMIENAYQVNELFEGIRLSRNCGHQNALLAGLMAAKERCEITISLDADLQDDIEVMEEFIRAYEKGSQIVYGVRSCRKKDRFFKRVSAEGFYKFLHLMGIQVVYNHADYRMMSSRVLRELENYQEVNVFLRGLVPLLGFQTSTVEYERKERKAGESKYPLKKMLGLAMDGITSFSIKPIQFVTALGSLMFVSSLCLMLVFLGKYFAGMTVDGWATIVTSVWGIGGLQLLGIGIIGEYIGKMYMETKRRPRYIIETYLGHTTEEAPCTEPF